MKKFLKALTTLGGAALAVAGGILVYRRFFDKDRELEEAFDDEELFEEDDEEVTAFDSKEAIFEQYEPVKESAPAKGPEETAEVPKAEDKVSVSEESEEKA